MSEFFWNLQTDDDKKRYIQLLQIVGSLSNLFADTVNPFLYYRAHENLFCEVFNAKNLSRGDISFDAVKGNLGIGLKTFLQGNGNTFQKVAEFNSDSDLFRGLVTDEEVIYKVSELRTKRIKMTQNATNTKLNLYHLITRDEGCMNVVETPMDLVDINSIKIPKKQYKNTIHFSDKYNEYSFSRSKNTLLKRFNTSEQHIICQFEVEILKNPFDILLNLSNYNDDKNNDLSQKQDGLEYIILPLYSPKDGKVQLRSGLNQWNAKGRPRHPDEVYIPIPSWIHTTFKEFFRYEAGKPTQNYPSFNVELPNGHIMKCKIAQGGGKALMSDPNKDLGHWILRDVLQIPEFQVLNMEFLNEVGIDSVKLSKKNLDYYLLDFMSSGSFKEFEENNKL
ncbi:NgoFVII family restriction endonuclease [Aerococcus urinae]|uniref:restriction endonuclease PLD domain-containing protein n=1 Tax=Aerococcus urinae TaxID=1376 RepID=UPI00227B6CD3|nr:restriction endonuclease PLD domain-containing protein [Aerococcus urinae]MCY3051438.1 NgoFVII family restriction endonuclease [Aerococcus urinae]